MASAPRRAAQHDSGTGRCAGERSRTVTARTLAAGLLLAGVFGLALPDVVHAAPIPWSTQVVSYNAERRPVSQVLRDVLATQPFPVVIATDLRGEVTGQFNEPAQQVVSKLAAAYGVVWFFDGTVLYLSHISDLRSELIELGSLEPARVNDLLAGLGLLEERFPVRVSRTGALVSGPSRYVELVAKALRAEAGMALAGEQGVRHSGAMHRPVQKRVRVFKLTHAQAGDMEHALDGRRVVIPGVATLLQRLGQAGDMVRMAEPEEPHTEALVDHHVERVAGIPARQNRSTDGRAQVSAAADGALVEADIRTNSVIVHASRELLDYYREVIEHLDQPQQLVQIDVTIMSVASSAVEELGVALGVRHPHAEGSTGNMTGQAAGLLFQGLVGNSARNLSIRIAALERSGKLKVLSRPKLVALENRQAVLGSRSTAYVRVAGAYQTDLYPVRAGLQVRLVPRVVSREGQPTSIHLSLDIADGSFEEATSVDGIPVANEAGISTEAVVGDGQTLLIGGHQRENMVHEHTGVPGLSRLPGIGALFRQKRRSHELTEQLFLITPRLVTVSASGHRAASGDPLSRAASRCPPISSVDVFGGAMRPATADPDHMARKGIELALWCAEAATRAEETPSDRSEPVGTSGGSTGDEV